MRGLSPPTVSDARTARTCTFPHMSSAATDTGFASAHDNAQTCSPARSSCADLMGDDDNDYAKRRKSRRRVAGIPGLRSLAGARGPAVRVVALMTAPNVRSIRRPLVNNSARGLCGAGVRHTARPRNTLSLVHPDPKSISRAPGLGRISKHAHPETSANIPIRNIILSEHPTDYRSCVVGNAAGKANSGLMCAGVLPASPGTCFRAAVISAGIREIIPVNFSVVLVKVVVEVIVEPFVFSARSVIQSPAGMVRPRQMSTSTPRVARAARLGVW